MDSLFYWNISESNICSISVLEIFEDEVEVDATDPDFLRPTNNNLEFIDDCSIDQSRFY